MSLASRALFVLFTAAAVLAGCGYSSTSTVRGSTVAAAPPTTGTGTGTSTPTTPVGSFGGATAVKGVIDAVVATPSVSGPLSVTAGMTQTVSIVFTSNDGLAITGFGITASLGTLPAGWSGPSSFACALVSIGSGCVLNLTYSPTAAGSGAVNIDYVFVDNAGFSRTGDTIVLPYVATAPNNVFAVAAPTGQVNAVIGKGAAAVIVSFVTDDENAATSLAVTTDLTALPAGWSSVASSFSCAIVSTGNGCQLLLSYAPTVAARGNLQIAYGYTDDAGEAKTAVINVPYSAASVGTVVATAAPNGQVNAIQMTGGQSVAVTFDTSDGKSASGLYLVNDLSKLPVGWSAGAASFGCDSISTGNGCQLQLTYAPKALTAGTLGLTYGYSDAGGIARMGVLNIPYAATTNDNVVATPSPSGQINAVVGLGNQAVSVNFATDDARPATALVITNGLNTLPDGWSAPSSSFACAGVTSGSACTLNLNYAPTAAGSGTLMLQYAYKNNANAAKIGTVAIVYRATTDDTVTGTPTSGALSVRSGSTNSMAVTFATDDGNPANALQLTSSLTSLPAGWSAGAATFGCPTVSAGTACVLALNYNPTLADSGTLTLAYSYTNDAGFPKTGTVSITYTAVTPYLYVTNSVASTVSACPINADDTLLGCHATGSTFTQPYGIVLSGSGAYISDQGGNAITRCSLGSSQLYNCVLDAASLTAPTYVVVNPAGTHLYVEQGNAFAVCSLAPGTGALAGCAAASAVVNPSNGLTLSSDGTHAYTVHANALEVCSVAGSGVLNACSLTGSGAPAATAILGRNSTVLYAASQAGGVISCAINPNATLGSCQSSAAGSNPQGIAFIDTTAFLSSGATTVTACTVGADGSMVNCTSYSDSAFNGTSGVAIR